MLHESPAATTDMTVLPGVLGCRTLRRTVPVRLGSNPLRLPGGPPASPERAGTAIFFALAALRSVPQAGSQLHGLTTAIHETPGLRAQRVLDAYDHRKAAGFAFTAVGVKNLGMTLGAKPGNFDM
jgi:hypothetical protein